MLYAGDATPEPNQLSSIAGQILTWGFKMLMRAIATLSILTAFGQGAMAQERPNLVHRVSCAVVRFYVAKYSEMAAEAWARSHGATDAEIEHARSCLTGSSVLAAVLRK